MSPEKIIVDSIVGSLASDAGVTTGKGQTSHTRGRGQKLHQDVRTNNDRSRHVGSNPKDNKSHFKGKGNVENVDATKADQELYIVPSRPSTIGQEADRKETAPVGREVSDNKLDEQPARPAAVEGHKARFTRPPNKSRSYDRLNKADRWQEEGYLADPHNLETLVFERSRSSEQLNLSGSSVQMEYSLYCKFESFIF